MPRILKDNESVDLRLRGKEFTPSAPGFAKNSESDSDEKAISSDKKAISELVKYNAEILKRIDDAQRMTIQTQNVLSSLIARHQVSVERLMKNIIQCMPREPKNNRRVEFDIKRGIDGKIKSVAANITEE